jgi:uncharacterized membrane protein
MHSITAYLPMAVGYICLVVDPVEEVAVALLRWKDDKSKDWRTWQKIVLKTGELTVAGYRMEINTLCGPKSPPSSPFHTP